MHECKHIFPLIFKPSELLFLMRGNAMNRIIIISLVLFVGFIVNLSFFPFFAIFLTS